MKTNNILLLTILFAFFAMQACKKDTSETTAVTETKTEQLNAMSEGATTISTEIQSFLNDALMVAIDSGYSVDDPPSVSSSASPRYSKFKSSNALSFGGWTGPDADGWYTRSYTGLYNYYEKVRKKDTIDYIRVMEYHGGDGSFENKTTTKYIKYTKNQKILYKGYSIWELSASGYSEISKTTWKIEFSDWNPLTSAGIYDWYWGVSENNGGNTIPMHRYEHLTATETSTEGWLHCRVICYDDGGSETWDFEYDTPWVPVVMPEIPEVPGE